MSSPVGYGNCNILQAHKKEESGIPASGLCDVNHSKGDMGTQKIGSHFYFTKENMVTFGMEESTKIGTSLLDKPGDEAVNQVNEPENPNKTATIGLEGAPSIKSMYFSATSQGAASSSWAGLSSRPSFDSTSSSDHSENPVELDEHAADEAFGSGQDEAQPVNCYDGIAMNLNHVVTPEDPRLSIGNLQGIDNVADNGASGKESIPTDQETARGNPDNVTVESGKTGSFSSPMIASRDKCAAQSMPAKEYTPEGNVSGQKHTPDGSSGASGPAEAVTVGPQPLQSETLQGIKKEIEHSPPRDNAYGLDKPDIQQDAIYNSHQEQVIHELIAQVKDLSEALKELREEKEDLEIANTRHVSELVSELHQLRMENERLRAQNHKQLSETVRPELSSRSPKHAQSEVKVHDRTQGKQQQKLQISVPNDINSIAGYSPLGAGRLQF